MNKIKINLKGKAGEDTAKASDTNLESKCRSRSVSSERSSLTHDRKRQDTTPRPDPNEDDDNSKHQIRKPQERTSDTNTTLDSNNNDDDRGRSRDRDSNSQIPIKTDTSQPQPDNDEDIISLMGFTGFGSTKGKHVTGTKGGKTTSMKKSEYRQYINRPKGFNRPLSPSRK